MKRSTPAQSKAQRVEPAWFMKRFTGGGPGWLREAWDDRADSWTQQVEESPAFRLVRERLLEWSKPRPEDDCLDLGAGGGFLTLALAPRVASVLAVDIAPEMLARLAASAQHAGLAGVRTQISDMVALELPEASLDLIVSSYALHSVPHQQKRVVLEAAYGWLRPGGRIVIADMMLGRGLSSRDRRILVDKVSRLLRNGPAGAWRALRNAAQLGLGVGENRPATPQWWQETLCEIGLVDVRYQDVVAEAGMITAVKR